MKLIESFSPDETREAGRQFAKMLKGGELVLFRGGLGMGKTTFTSGIAEGLGCSQAASSPTYAIVNVYEGRLMLAHFDLYRIESADDLEAAGFYDYLDEGAVLLVEWSENIANLGELAAVSPIIVDICSKGENHRIISIEGMDS